MVDRPYQRPAPLSFNGRTPGFELGDHGSNPCRGAKREADADIEAAIEAMREGGCISLQQLKNEIGFELTEEHPRPH